MIYYTVVLTRKSAMTQEEFERHWLTDHLALARTLPGLISARFYPLAPGQEQVEFGGFGVLCFPDQQTLEAAVSGEVGLALRAHTATFADSSGSHRLVAREPVEFVAET